MAAKNYNYESSESNRDYLQTKMESSNANVRLECYDGDILVRRETLVTESSYFKSLLQSSTSSTTKTLTFSRLNLHTMTHVLYYIRTKIVLNEALSENQIMDIIYASRKMELQPLFNHWWTRLENSISLENFGFIWDAAIYYQDQETIINSVNLVMCCAKQIINSHCFALRQLRSCQMEQLIDLRKFMIPPGHLATIVCVWGNYDISRRKPFVIGFCKQIPAVTEKWMNHLMLINIVAESGELQEILMHN